MATLLGYLVFAAFLVAQIAAVVVYAARTSRGSDSLGAMRLDAHARAIWDCGG